MINWAESKTINHFLKLGRFDSHLVVCNDISCVNQWHVVDCDKVEMARWTEAAGNDIASAA